MRDSHLISTASHRVFRCRWFSGILRICWSDADRTLISENVHQQHSHCATESADHEFRRPLGAAPVRAADTAGAVAFALTTAQNSRTQSRSFLPILSRSSMLSLL